MKRMGAGLLIVGAATALVAGFGLHSAPRTIAGIVFTGIGLLLFIYAEKQTKS